MEEAPATYHKGRGHLTVVAQPFGMQNFPGLLPIMKNATLFIQVDQAFMQSRATTILSMPHSLFNSRIRHLPRNNRLYQLEDQTNCQDTKFYMGSSSPLKQFTFRAGGLPEKKKKGLTVIVHIPKLCCKIIS